MHKLDQNFKMLAKTFYGFESTLEEELLALGAQKVTRGNRMVSFWGDLGFLYKANLCLRTALKILVPLHTETVKDYDALYALFFHYPWEDYMTVDQTFALDSVVFGTSFTHSQYAVQRAKDGLVDRFQKHFGKRPNVSKNLPDLKINIHIQGDQCTFSLDSSGASLHHRGYRTATNIAPINEVLAAGLIILSGWKGNTPFLDPMCGSGTLVIEAAMMAAQMPANHQRKRFAFQSWTNWDAALFETIKSAQMARMVVPSIQIMGSDKAPSAVEKAIVNAQNAGVSDFVSFEKIDFFQRPKLTLDDVHLVTNPPYGERLDGNIEALYQSIGDTFKQSFSKAHAWLISSNFDAMKHIGLRPSRKIKLFNGKLESRLLYFPIYEGTKRVHKRNLKS
ncbi:MAG: THUMP domain-containing class I SAM-dependent RNA methyltransferase [Flavobacteriaceae bacterium]